MKKTWLILLITALGCSQSDQGIVHVEGSVSLNGEPLDSGIVSFFPESGRGATGFIEQDGTFTLGTLEKDDGAILGIHKVTVTAQKASQSGRPNFDSDATDRSAEDSAIPIRYANPESSGLSFEVKLGEANNFAIELEN